MSVGVLRPLALFLFVFIPKWAEIYIIKQADPARKENIIMFKTIITGAIISKGYGEAPALKFSDNKNAVNFKIGYRVYDTKAKDNYRYINMAVKAFGSVCERIEKMQLKESSHINIMGRLDEDQWEEDGQKFSRYVIIAEEIEYASSDSGKSNGNGNGKSAGNTNNAGSAAPAQNGQGQQAVAAPQQGGQTGMPSGFTGYENVGENNPFFPGN